MDDLKLAISAIGVILIFLLFVVSITYGFKVDALAIFRQFGERLSIALS